MSSVRTAPAFSTAPAPPTVPPPVPATPRVPRPATSALAHLRATAAGMGVLILLLGIGYPLMMVGFAEAVTPHSANGSLVTGPNGTIVGSILVGQNLSLPGLFWERPSVTDYEMTLGAPSPPGPDDPALRAEVLAYLAQYANYSLGGVNHTLTGNFTQWILTDSGSGVDPNILTADALVQIPRVAAASHLSVAVLTDLVHAHVQVPPLGLPGPSYVNVLELDIALVELPGY